MFWAYGGTASSTCSPSVNSLIDLSLSGYAALDMVVTASSRGVAVVPVGRNRATRVWNATGLRFLRLAKVSVRTVPSVSLCPLRDVRWMSPAA